MFRDRTEAGERLAALLVERGVDADVVLAIPRGGLPIGRPVADALDAPLDVVVAKKLGAPGNAELAVGAVSDDGVVWVNHDIVGRLGVSHGYLETERAARAAEAREKAERYRGDRPPLDLAGKRVVVVDDGLATGATALACVRKVREAGADRVTLAVPVASASGIERLAGEVDEVVNVETPPYFGAVGQFYRSFAQVSDAEARTYLD